MHPPKRWIAALAALPVLAGAGAALAASLVADGRVGPAKRLLANGRKLTPQGRLTDLGNFPTGGALTPDGRFYWTVSTGRGQHDIRIVSVASGHVIQVIPLAGSSGGIAMDPSGRRAYVSGVSQPTLVNGADYRIPNAPGKDGDVVLAFSYASSGPATLTGVIPVAPPSDASAPQHFPPTNSKKIAWPDRLAVSSDGRRLLVPLNLADAAAIVDVASRGVRYVSTGSYPYGAAILRDNRTGLVSNEAKGTVSVIDLETGKKVKDIQAGAPLSHPEAIGLDPRADRAYVAIANSDQVAVIDTRRLDVERTLSVELPQGNGASPVALSVTRDGSQLLVADAGSDDVAVFALPTAATARNATVARAARRAPHRQRQRRRRRPAPVASPAPFTLIGRIPVGDYPTDVQVTPTSAALCARAGSRTGSTARVRHRRSRRSRLPARLCTKLVWTAGKGLGVGPVGNGPDPYRFTSDYNDSGSPVPSNSRSFDYLPDIIRGKAGVLDYPSVTTIRALTPAAARQLTPSNQQPPPAGTPLRPGGPIKHVFYIVKENRTYDQVLGDDSRGDGDPRYTLFGRQVTPNLHALVARFPLLDHFYADSEASIDGHFWTSAAKVSDYVQKNWPQNYRNDIASGGQRPYDFGAYTVTFPANGFLFDQADRQGISYFNYGEALAGVSPLPDKDRDQQGTQDAATKLAHSDVALNGGCYPADFNVGTDAVADRAGQGTREVFDSSPPLGASPTAESRFDCFKQRFQAQLASGSVPAFNALILNSDHTRGAQPGQRTPRAMIAENDYALGQVVDLVSHSSVWRDSAIFVIEDDSQDGSDHVDAHRMTAAVISPYAKPAAVIHTRYDQMSAVRSLELILGMRPLGLFDALAVPMYDAFQSAPNDEPFSVITPTYNLLERNAAGTAAARASSRLDFSGLDRVSQRQLDRLVWKTVHGDRSEPPPPGPNAVPGG